MDTSRQQSHYLKSYMRENIKRREGTENSRDRNSSTNRRYRCCNYKAPHRSLHWWQINWQTVLLGHADLSVRLSGVPNGEASKGIEDR